tara:strand:- start:56 stop:307 length:252 start_codon:yes stop_codon:yes gene_type:complete
VLFSCSRTNKRVNPNIPEKIKVIQRIPGARLRIVWGVNLKAKLKITRINMAKVRIDVTMSLLRTSATMSFQTMVLTSLKTVFN